MSIDLCADCGDLFDTDMSPTQPYGTDGKCRCEKCICELDSLDYTRFYEPETYRDFENFVADQEVLARKPQ
jgi:hypothetical protein